jgi:hypothetical protein
MPRGPSGECDDDDDDAGANVALFSNERVLIRIRFGLID